MKIYLLFFLNFTLFSGLVFSQVPELNQPAPTIKVNDWVSNPNYSDTEIKGKPIVLKFWFTTCGPCVYSIPHFNDLVEEFHNEDIAFISISFEEPEIIRAFIEEKEFRSMMGSDTSQVSINNYRVQGFPVVFLIDSDGVLRWKGYPMSLNKSMISYFLNIESENSGTINIEEETNRINELGITNANYSLEIDTNKTQMGVASGRYSDLNELTIANYSLKKVLSYLLNQSEYRLSIPDTASEKFDIRFKSDQGLSSINNLNERLASVISDRLGFRLATVTEIRSAYVLSVAHDSLFTSNFVDTESKSTGTSSGSGFWRGHGLSIKQVINTLEDSYQMHFEAELPKSNKYKVELPTDNFKSLESKLLDVYGIKLTQKEVEIEMYTLFKE
ncbi:peroxiredoxin family protein [Gracilimonas sp.]|uniref:peroxiredoxin family protein n=1 Tax=Gracilimonas sp. TaxID=1974203 RepID=UPI003BAC3A12